MPLPRLDLLPISRRLPRVRVLLIALAAMSAGSAWADGSRAGTGPADPMAEVQRLIGDAACRNDADCRTVGVGHRACGGPQAYLPWSAWRTSARALDQAAAATRAPARATAGAAPARTPEPMMSTCQVAVDPGARCVGATPGTPGGSGRSGTCQLRQDAPTAR